MGPTDRLVVIAQSYDASTALLFDGLSDKTKRHVSFVQPRDPQTVEQAIAQASVVLIAREIVADPIKYAAATCIRMGKPYYYYADDNFWVLKDEMPQYSSFGAEDIKTYIRSSMGIVVSSDNLAEFVLSNGIHDTVLKVTPVLDRSLLQRRDFATAEEGMITIAFVGSEVRYGAFARTIAPAIARLATDGTRFRVIVRQGNDLRTLSFHGIPTVQMPVAYTFAEYIVNWRRYRPDILVHPHADSKNTKYKTSSIMLSAYLLGAVPVVGSEPAFAGLTARDGVHLVAEESVEAWASALSALRPPKSRARLYRALGAHCERVFGPKGNERTVARILEAGRNAVNSGRNA